MAPNASQPDDETAQLNVNIPIGEKARLLEIAHERTTPGRNKVTLSDVVRDAVRLYTDHYGTEEGPSAQPEVRGKLAALEE